MYPAFYSQVSHSCCSGILSYKDLKVLIFPALLIYSGNLFHFSATRLVKKFLLTSVLHLVVGIFNASEDYLVTLTDSSNLSPASGCWYI